jgi:Kdo2-lipid IVA lauroyltransferase/acyltransferase
MLPTRMKKTTQQNLQSCFPEWEKGKLDACTRESLQHTAMTALEMGKAWLWPMEKTLNLVVEVEGREVLDRAMASRRGVIVLAPHHGNWEIFGFYITEILESTFLYQPARDSEMDELAKAGRSRGKAKLAPTNVKGVAELLRALKKGEGAGVLPDQEPALESGLFAPFFGFQALTMTLVSKLVSRTGAQVICGFAMRLPEGRGFKVIIKDADPLIYSEDPLQSVTGLNRSVEACVRHALPQYQWEYKRFKRRPDGQRFYK